jgi:hypothetical protein
MSENNNNDFSKQMNEFLDKAVKTVQDCGKKAADRLDLEKQKAGIRSEIGHTKKVLSDAYDQLGRGYYAYKMSSTEMVDEQVLLDRITEKENQIKELNEKLNQLG